MQFSFDGKGINDKSDVYASRVATLTEHGHNINAGPLLAAAPELLAALQACMDDGFLAGEVLDQAATAIAKATSDA